MTSNITCGSAFSRLRERQPIVTTLLRGTIDKAAHSDHVQDRDRPISARSLAISMRPEFQKFWDIDAKRVDEAVIAIGRVQG